MNSDGTPKLGHPVLLCGFSGYYKNKILVHSLGKLLTYGHQICKAGAPDTCVITERFTPGLTYFCKNPILGQIGTQIVIAAHRDL